MAWRYDVQSTAYDLPDEEEQPVSWLLVCQEQLDSPAAEAAAAVVLEAVVAEAVVGIGVVVVVVVAAAVAAAGNVGSVDDTAVVAVAGAAAFLAAVADSSVAVEEEAAEAGTLADLEDVVAVVAAAVDIGAADTADEVVVDILQGVAVVAAVAVRMLEEVLPVAVVEEVPSSVRWRGVSWSPTDWRFDCPTEEGLQRDERHLAWLVFEQYPLELSPQEGLDFVVAAAAVE